MLAGAAAAGAGGISDGASSGGAGPVARLLAAPRPAFPVERCVGSLCSRFICTASSAGARFGSAALPHSNSLSNACSLRHLAKIQFYVLTTGAHLSGHSDGLVARNLEVPVDVVHEPVLCLPRCLRSALSRLGNVKGAFMTYPLPRSCR